MVREFIEGWDLLQVLGEGTFAEVKLLVNRDTGEACAMKEINIAQNPAAVKSAQKEICVHKLLKHPNIVQCYGSRIESSHQFIFLEYCSGGELFDRIEPEMGMPEHQAQYYFRQLMAAVNYLHHRGVAHRDIKPENLLLTDSDVLKLSDFGMATVFRHQGKERLLERRCGTTAYCAPEMLNKPRYNAEPADIWSCGIVLVAMVTGGKFLLFFAKVLKAAKAELLAAFAAEEAAMASFLVVHVVHTHKNQVDSEIYNHSCAMPRRIG